MIAASQQSAGTRITVELLAFVGLLAFYLVTAPQNHSTAGDAYSYAYMIRDQSILAVPELRLFLWIASMQALYAAVSWLAPNADTFAVIGAVDAAEAALAVILLERLLSHRLGLRRLAACLTAAMFACSYGTWRFAAEVEVYSAAALISIVLLHLTLSMEPADAGYRPARLVLLAVLAALATLCYQPLGIVGALAIPVYLLLARSPLIRIVTYYAVSGVVVAAGLALASYLDHVHSGAHPQFVLDADGKLPTLPSASDMVKSAIAFAQNLFSVNWAFAFEPTREIIERNWAFGFAQELFAAEFAGSGYLVVCLTLPAVAGLLVAACLTILRRGPRRPLRAIEVAVIFWLMAYAAMVLLLDPTGFEAWIPALVPFFVLFGLRVIGPVVDLGRSQIAVALLAVFLVHNSFAGVGVVASSDHNYYDRRAGPIIAQTGPDDLIVVVEDWEFSRYLSYSAEARTILVRTPGDLIEQEPIEKTLASGGKVFLFDDWVSVGTHVIERPGLDADVHALSRFYLEGARRIDLGELGQAFQILPGDR